MSDDKSWAPPQADDGRPSTDEQPSALPPLPPPPPVAPAPAAAPQYGQYAPPPQPPQYGQYPPPQPQYGQYAPPAAPQYGQYPPPQPQYGQHAPPPSAPAGQQLPYYAQQGAPQQPGANAWAPPPKPGLIPLRPLGFGTLLGAPFQVLRRNPRPTFGSGLIVQLVVLVVTVLFVGLAVAFTFARATSLDPDAAGADAIGAGNIALLILSGVLSAAVSLFGSALLQAVLVIEVASATLGEKRKLGALWKAAFRRILPLTAWFALVAVAVVVVIAIAVLLLVAVGSSGSAGVGVAVLLGVLFAFGLAALAVWLGTKLALVPCAIVLEHLGVGAAMKRSWRLTARSFWKTFGVLALVYGILSVASQILQTPFSILANAAAGLLDPNNSGTGVVVLIVLSLVFLAFSIVIGAVSAVVEAATVAVVYLDLRMRKEGLDIELARFVEARQSGLETVADPYLPRNAG